MIVKNEALVIQRCLDSVRSTIDHWVIVDTGSTDGTQDVIRAALADIPGTLFERPWLDFAFNRNEALDLARPHAAYSLIIDADDQFIAPDGFVMPKLTEAGYMFEILDAHTKYWRVQLVNNRVSWRYRGVVHEFLECPGNPDTPTLPLSVRRGVDGGRHNDGRAEQRDLAALEKALSVEKDPVMIARYTFYLARSYRDTGEDRKALELYLQRANLGHWDEEVYVSLLNAARLTEQLNEPAHKVLSLYDRAIRTCPARAEARHGAIQFCNRKQEYAVGYQYGVGGLSQEIPREGIAIIPWIYIYGLREEFSICAYHVGEYRVCLSVCFDILGEREVPGNVLSRTADLARKALTKMVDPVWGSWQPSYSAEVIPAWQICTRKTFQRDADPGFS